ncbi:expressed unknown protein [Seminavis robusta]|uniref:G-protein coupled receptors family 1 profile domain-containing protein n=1 Tax=Seminavis robusta TaxID=568900 RepID=A0A9N8H6D1_9STRA|nr:expressed unknown protein [Seminavis robusta]|eukprot:Sro97_g049890.1 n/a (476) ;mRNA; r:30869-32488
MTNWNATTFETTNWTNVYPVLDPAPEEFVEYNETFDDEATDTGSTGYTFTHRHVVMSVVPHITGLLSLVGSSFIVIDIYRKRFRSVHDRLHFGLAVSDIIASLGMALSTWPVPRYQAQSTWGALGNIHSCEFQGFIIQLGLATPLYSAGLSIYYVLLVKFSFRPDSKQMLCWEKICHCFATSLALVTAVISLAMKQYNNANVWCWIAPYPYGCEDKGTCERGNHATILRMVFYFSWLWASFIIVTVCMILLVHTVVAQNSKMDRYRQRGQQRSKSRDKNVRDVVIQSTMYILAFMITALPLSVARIYQAKYSCSSTFFPLSMTTVTVFPLQGFWNAIIFFKTRFIRHVSEGPIGKHMARLSSRMTLNSSSIQGFSLKSMKSKGGSSLRDLFGSGGETKATSSRESSGSGHLCTHDAEANASVSIMVLDLSDSSEGESDTEGGNKSWCITDLQRSVAALKASDCKDDGSMEGNDSQ